MQFTYAPELDPLLAEIEEYLVTHTPDAVAGLKVTEPAYAVFLWYDDSSTLPIQICPDFGVGTEAVRAACAEEYEGDRPSINDCVWRPMQEMEDEVADGRFNDKAFATRCQQAYKLMWAANTTGKPLDEKGDAVLLLPFRTMMHRVARRLNAIDWSGIVKPTDDYVVVATERIGYWLVEDMAASIPAEKLALLKKRRRFPSAN
jgi:hypothetical protein